MDSRELKEIWFIFIIIFIIIFVFGKICCCKIENDNNINDICEYNVEREQINNKEDTIKEYS